MRADGLERAKSSVDPYDGVVSRYFGDALTTNEAT